MPANHAANLPPRLLRLGEAAAYCGRCVTKFKAVCPVPAIDMGDGLLRWDRRALDRWIDGADHAPAKDWLAELDDDGDGRARAGH